MFVFAGRLMCVEKLVARRRILGLDNLGDEEDAGS